MAMKSGLAKAIEKNNAGVKMYQEGKLKEALHAFLEAIKANPDYAVAHHHLGLLYYKMGNYRDAVHNFLAAKALNYSSMQLDYYLKLAQKEVRDVDPFVAAKEVADRPLQTLCPACGEPVNSDFDFCPMCRARLGAAECAGCGAKVKPEWQACPYCGKDLPRG